MQAPMRVILYGLIGLTSGVLIAAERPKRDAQAMEEAVAVQVLLDRANFGPGKIDGHYGDFTKKALDRYRRVKGTAPSATQTQPAAAPQSAAAGEAPAAELPEPQPLAAVPAGEEG